MSTPRPPQPLTDVTDVEQAYLHLIRRHGRRAPVNRRVDIQRPVADDGESDCWTHAWKKARQTDATYVEGVCFRPGADGPSFHAWMEETNPLTGRTLVECTPGYENATRYLGIPVDTTPGGLVDMLTQDWTLRVSVIQAALAGGRTPAQVLHAVTARAA